MTFAFDRISPARQEGSALATVLVAMMLVAFVIVIISTSALSSMDRVKRSGERKVGMAAADNAITTFQYALQSTEADESTGFLLGRFDNPRTTDIEGIEGVLRARGAAGWQIIPNGSLPASFQQLGLHRTLVPAQFQYTVKEQYGPNNFGYWQVLASLPPSFEGSNNSYNLVVYIRAWVANADASISTRPRVIRVEYRPGRFADYQLISDGPITFNVDGAEIQAPIHTNGYADRYFRGATTGIRFNAPTTCRGRAELSTARGSIYGARGSCAGVPRSTGNGIEISFLRVEDTFAYLERRCSTPIVTCVNRADGPYTVQISGSNVNWRSSSGLSGTVRAVDTSAVLFDGDVRLSGWYDTTVGALSSDGGRLTIAAHRRSCRDPDTGAWICGARATREYTDQPADIIITDDTGARRDNTDVVGLIAQGNIVLKIDGCSRGDRSPVPRHIRAAMVAESGALTIPPEYVIPQMPPAAQDEGLPFCSGLNPDIEIRGSIAGHYAPTLALEWTNRGTTLGQVGYNTRKYSYNRNLYLNPPPFFPLTGPWQVQEWSDANVSCLEQIRTATSMAGLSACR